MYNNKNIRLEQTIIDNLVILENKLKNRLEYLKVIIDKEYTYITLKILIGPYNGDVYLYFNLSDINLIQAELSVSHMNYSDTLDSFKEEINENDNIQLERIINFINRQEYGILNLVEEFQFYLPIKIRKLFKDSFDILNYKLISNGVTCEFSDLKTLETQKRYSMRYEYKTLQSKILHLGINVEKKFGVCSLKVDLRTIDSVEVFKEIEVSDLDFNSDNIFEILSEVVNFIIESEQTILFELDNVHYYSKELSDDIDKIINLFYENIKIIDPDIKLTIEITYHYEDQTNFYSLYKENSAKIELIIETYSNLELLIYRFYKEHDGLTNEQFEISISEIDYDLDDLNNFLNSNINKIIKIVNKPEIEKNIFEYVYKQINDSSFKLADKIKTINPAINYDISSCHYFYIPFIKSLSLIFNCKIIETKLVINVELKNSYDESLIFSEKLESGLDIDYIKNTFLHTLDSCILEYQNKILENINVESGEINIKSKIIPCDS